MNEGHQNELEETLTEVFYTAASKRVMLNHVLALEAIVRDLRERNTPKVIMTRMEARLATAREDLQKVQGRSNGEETS